MMPSNLITILGVIAKLKVAREKIRLLKYAMALVPPLT